MSIKYTIIVPVYNVVSYLAECLDSVLAQNEDSWECIAVDDGSTDGRGRVLDDYAEKDRRFMVVLKDNGGVASARNVALDLSNGEWIVYLDADDMLATNALAELSRMEHLHPDADMLRYALVSFSNFVQDKGPQNQGNILKYTDKQAIIDGWNGPSFVTYAYKRSLMGDLRFKPYSMGEDRLYLAEALLRVNIKVESNYVGYYCRERNGSAMRSAPTRKKVSDAISWKQDILDLFNHCDILIGKSARRRIILSLLEGDSYKITKLPQSERKTMWKLWFKAIDGLPVHLVPSNWIRFVLCIIQHNNSCFMAYLLCVLPQKLKLSGFHR